MSRENEQLSTSINTTESVVDYLLNQDGANEDSVTKMIMDGPPTAEMKKKIFEEIIPADRAYFFWYYYEYKRML